MKHIPVLLTPVLDLALSQDQSGPKKIWDATFGRGGHTRELLKKYPESVVIGTDRDEAAIQFGEENFREEILQGRLQLKHFNFHEFKSPGEMGESEGFDSILIDLGVSSPQLDEPERGFSFYQDGPLDMRMDQRQDFKAADIINTWSEADLIQLFQEVGEVSRPHRVVREILERRKEREFTTTMELSLLIERTFGWRKKGKHPATNFFLALRMEVNQELSELHQAIHKILTEGLRPKGRLLIITFHSSEDRIIKRLFKSCTEFGTIMTKKVIAPERSEILLNPRSRSAKLRVFERKSMEETSSNE